MQRRIRIPLILTVVIGVYFTLPYFLGLAAQHYSAEFIQQENATLGDMLGVNLRLVDYQRGWFQSHAQLQLERQSADGSFEVAKTIPVTIMHGPVYQWGRHMHTGLALIAAPNITLDNVPAYTLSFRDNIGFQTQRGELAFLPVNPADQSIQDVHADALTLFMRSNLKADHFVFSLVGNGLHFQNPHHTIFANVKTLRSTLDVNYLNDHHWQMRLATLLNRSQVSVRLPQSTSVVALDADSIAVDGVHFDTQKLVKLGNELGEIKTASDAGEVVPPSTWMALIQEFLTQVISDDTSVSVTGVSFVSPMGKMQFHYRASFPTLPIAHDYFDVATHDVSQLALTVPSWLYDDTDMNMEFSLSNLKLDTQNNTVFSRHLEMALGAFDIKNTKAKDSAPLLYATGVSYNNDSTGDVKNLSQIMNWHANQVCFSEDCFKQIQGKLTLSKMNFDAFRGIAAATQQVVQSDPTQAQSVSERWMNLANAYSNLVTKDTQMTLSHDMMTALGDMKLYAAVSWPTLSAVASQTGAPPLLMNAVYEVRAQFPAEYATAFLAQEKSEAKAAAHAKAGEAPPPSAEMQTADMLQYAIDKGYLKQEGSAFVLDLTGKGDQATINGVTWQAP